MKGLGRRNADKKRLLVALQVPKSGWWPADGRTVSGLRESISGRIARILSKQLLRGRNDNVTFAKKKYSGERTCYNSYFLHIRGQEVQFQSLMNREELSKIAETVYFASKPE